MNSNTQQTLQQYIDSQRRAGIPDQVIERDLLGAGWELNIVRGALGNNAIPSPFVTSVPAPAQQGMFTTSKPTSTNNTVNGRLNRIGFLLGQLYILGYFTAVVLIGEVGHAIPFISSFIILNVLICSVMLIVVHFTSVIRRWHDLDQTGWLTLLTLIPLVSIVTGVILVFRPGTPTANKYGMPYSGSLSALDLWGLRRK